MHPLLPASLALALATPLLARADTPPTDLGALRQEIEAIRSDYQARLQALEQRLRAAEAALATPPLTPPPAPLPAALPAPQPAPGGSGGANAFNPAMSLILSGLYTRTTQDPAAYALRGFLLPAGTEAGPGRRGLSLAETELGLAASIDPWWRGAASIALHPDNSLSVEEAYVQTTALGHGLSLKAGRFLSGVGTLNARHAHTWDFVDQPLAYQAMLGTQLADDGLQATWLAPTELFVELGLELGQGRSFPAGAAPRNGAGLVAVTWHAGGDLGASHSWRVGLSALGARADEQALLGLSPAGAVVNSAFTGRTRVTIADAVWKWAPNGNATRTSLTLQGEYLRSVRSGSLLVDPLGAASGGSYRAVQSGGYLQAVYQFMPRWRVGLRSERLDGRAPDYGPNAGLLAAGGQRPAKQSLMVDFSPSEFSRIRLQAAQDRSRPGSPDAQLFLQYQMSLGAHGAHSY